MKISFDRKEYLSVSSVFENESLDDVDDELSEFNDDATDMAYELAYTRYALAKIEARYHALCEAVAWERETDECGEWLHLAWWDNPKIDLLDIWDIHHAARAEVDRLLQEPPC